MKNKILSNKGVSPLVATVLLIVLAIVLFGVIFIWIRGMIAENIEKFGEPIETQCQNVVFTANKEGNNIIVNNQGNIPILGMNIQVNVDGKKRTKSLRKPEDGVVSIGEIDEIPVEIEFQLTGKVTIIPVIQGKGTESGKFVRYVCKTKSVPLV